MTIAPANPSVMVALPADTRAFDRAVGQPYEPYRTTLLTPDEVRGFSTLRPRLVILDTLRCWSVVTLAAFTAYDTVRATLGARTSAMLMIVRKP